MKNDTAKIPEILRAAERGAARRWGIALLVAWVAWGATDWGMRFAHFRWQNRWLAGSGTGKAASGGSANGGEERRVETRRGGDLSQFLPVKRVAERYAEVYAGWTDPIDEYGRVNDRGRLGNSDAVVAGDSFLTNRGGGENFVQALERVTGLRLYNQGMPGSGAILPLRRYVEDRAGVNHPQTVIWAITARDLEGQLFGRQGTEAWFAGGVGSEKEPSTKGGGRGRIRWDALGARELDRALPNTSVTAWAARKVWARMRLGVLGAWPREVVPMEGEMLGYWYNLTAFERMSPERDGDAIVETILRVARGLDRRGERLAVVLIPEKEQIYPDRLPGEWRGRMEGSVRLAEDVVERLKKAGIPALALHGVFRAAAANGSQLYWRDDTHWNAEGIRLGAEATGSWMKEWWGEDGAARRSGPEQAP